MTEQEKTDAILTLLAKINDLDEAWTHNRDYMAALEDLTDYRDELTKTLAI